MKSEHWDERTSEMYFNWYSDGLPFNEGLPYVNGFYTIVRAGGVRETAVVDMSQQYKGGGLRWYIPRTGETLEQGEVAAWKTAEPSKEAKK